MAAATGTYSKRTHDGGGGDGGELEHTALSIRASPMRQTEGNDGSWSRQQIKRAGYTKEEMRRRRDVLEETRASLQVQHDNYCGFEAAISTSSKPQAMEFVKALVELRKKTWSTGQIDWGKMRGLMVIDLIWLFGAVVARDEPKDAQKRKECLNKALEDMARTKYAQTGFSPSSSSFAARSPDTASPIYPERAIRPLPRNRLKSKLSPEQASTIQFPPEPPPISPTLSFNIPETSAPSQHRRLTNGHSHHDHDHDDEDYDICQHRHGHRVVHHHCTCHEDADSGEDEVEFDHPDYRYPPAPIANGTAVKPVDSLQRRLVEASRASGKSPPSGSTASSADGYESFENTSNKKKRKIPLSGASSMHQSSLSAEMANMGISNTPREGALDDISVHGMTAAELEQYHAQNAHASNGASGTGISGAGRGRFGRQQDARHRKPLGHAVNTTNLHNSRHPNGSGNSARNGDLAGESQSMFQLIDDDPLMADLARSLLDSGSENTGGIISQAIKTAAEQGPLTPAVKGRENHPAHAAPYGTPTPQRHLAAPGKTTHGTQTTPSHRGGHPPANTARPPPPPATHAPPAGHHPQQQQHQQPAPPPKPRPRRNPTREYALQAAQRKKNQQYQNYHHQPKPQDMYICMYCEYEDIYGEPPYALIRQYEIRDRKEKKKAAEKRRLLEKAKMKGRKNKKGAKGKNNAVNNAANPAPAAHPQNYDPNLPPPDDEEFYDDEEDDYEGDDYDPTGEEGEYDEGYYPPPPAPVNTPAIPRTERAPG